MTQASRNSRISGFHRKSPQERLKIVADFAGLDSGDNREPGQYREP